MTLTHVYKQNWGTHYFCKPAEISPNDADDLYCALCGHRVLLRGSGDGAYFEHEPGRYDCAEKPSAWQGNSLSMPTPGQSFVLRQPERKSRIDNPIVYATSPSQINESVVFPHQQAASLVAPVAQPAPQLDPLEEDELLKTEAVDISDLPGELGMYYAETQAIQSPNEIMNRQTAAPAAPARPAHQNANTWNQPQPPSQQAAAFSQKPWNMKTAFDESLQPNPDLQATIMDEDSPMPSYAQGARQISISDAAKPKVTVINSVPIPKLRNPKSDKTRTILLAASTVFLLIIVMTLVIVAISRTSEPEPTPTIKNHK